MAATETKDDSSRRTSKELERWILSLGVLEAQGFGRQDGASIYVSMRLARSQKFMREGRYLLSRSGEIRCRTSSASLAEARPIWNEAASWDVLRDETSDDLCLRLRVKLTGGACPKLQKVLLGEVTVAAEAMRPSGSDLKSSFVYWLPLGPKGAQIFDGSSPTPSSPSSAPPGDKGSGSNQREVRIVMQWAPASKVATSDSALSKASRADDARAPRKNSFSGLGSLVRKSSTASDAPFGGTRLAQVLADFESQQDKAVSSSSGPPRIEDPQVTYCKSHEFSEEQEDKNEAQDASTTAATDAQEAASSEARTFDPDSEVLDDTFDLSKSLDDIITSRLMEFEDERRQSFEQIVCNISEDDIAMMQDVTGLEDGDIQVDLTDQTPKEGEVDEDEDEDTKPVIVRKGLGNWQNGDGEAFRCRVGPNYNKNKNKALSGKSLYRCVGVDIIKANYKIDKVAHTPEKLNSVIENATSNGNEISGPLPRMIVVNFQLPYEAGPRFYGPHPPDDHGCSVVVQFVVLPETQTEASNLDSARPCIKLLHKFFSKQRQEKKKKGEIKEGPDHVNFKCIGVIENLDSLTISSFALPFVKKFNSTPVLIEKECTMLPCSDKDVFELDVDIRGFNAMARQLLSQLREQLLATVAHVGLLVQGCSDDELPENILGAFYMSNIDLMDCEDIANGQEATPPSQASQAQTKTETSKGEAAGSAKPSIKEEFIQKKEDVEQRLKRASQDLTAKVEEVEQRLKEKKEELNKDWTQTKEEMEQKIKEKKEDVKERIRKAQEEFETGVREAEERFKEASREMQQFVKRSAQGAERKLGRIRSWSSTSEKGKPYGKELSEGGSSTKSPRPRE